VREILDEYAVQRGPSGLRFWGKLVLSARLQSLLVELNQPAGPDVEVLKFSTRRSVFRVRGVAPELPSLIVKGFPLAKIESRVKYRKYGLAEFCHYQQAASQSIPMPACYGYFEVRALGMVKANGVLIEDLAGCRSLGELIQAKTANKREVLARAIPLMKQLYESGVNHVDINLNNLLESRDGSLLRLIDWQYCSFVTPRQPAQLLLQAIHFLSTAGVETRSPDADDWLEQLLQATGCPLPAAAFLRAAASLQARHKITATERLGLTLDAATQALLADAGGAQ
jgi:Lipopolysaccharide kinase (Kdo/WaaP) family